MVSVVLFRCCMLVWLSSMCLVYGLLSCVSRLSSVFLFVFVGLMIVMKLFVG